MTSYRDDIEMLLEAGRLKKEEKMEACRARRLARFRKYLGYDTLSLSMPLPDKITETLTFDNLTMALSVDLVEAKKNLITIGNMEFFYDQIDRYVEAGWEWPD